MRKHPIKDSLAERTMATCQWEAVLRKRRPAIREGNLQLDPWVRKCARETGSTSLNRNMREHSGQDSRGRVWSLARVRWAPLDMMTQVDRRRVWSQSRIAA